jgi:hypothetical protein
MTACCNMKTTSIRWDIRCIIAMRSLINLTVNSRQWKSTSQFIILFSEFTDSQECLIIKRWLKTMWTYWIFNPIYLLLMLLRWLLENAIDRECVLVFPSPHSISYIYWTQPGLETFQLRNHVRESSLRHQHTTLTLPRFLPGKGRKERLGI